MPSWPIEMPSDTEMVPNSSGKPPAACTPSLTALASRSSDRLQGVISFQLEATPTCGFSQSSSPIPTARSMPRDAVASSPSVTTRERGLMSTPAPAVGEAAGSAVVVSAVMACTLTRAADGPSARSAARDRGGRSAGGASAAGRVARPRPAAARPARRRARRRARGRGSRPAAAAASKVRSRPAAVRAGRPAAGRRTPTAPRPRPAAAPSAGRPARDDGDGHRQDPDVVVGPGQRRGEAGAQPDQRDGEHLLPPPPPVRGDERAQQGHDRRRRPSPSRVVAREVSPRRKKTPSSDWLPA